ncbi:MAG TPA: class IV adenylate cyclase [Anaerolineales bacterium]
MPSNIEIKARARDFNGIRSRAATLADTPLQVIVQEDTFFAVPQGRLKLRVRNPDPAQLIYYERPDQGGPKRSDYQIFETEDPERLKLTLSRALGIRGIVRKTRYLYLVGQTRVHLDDVEGLGQFMELEVVLRPDQPDADGQAIARDLMAKLGVAESELLEGAYMDLLEQRQGRPDRAQP